eukprot:contig_24815_g6127
MSVNFDGCSLGDVATLAGLCRSAPVDSLVLPLAVPEVRLLRLADLSSRYTAMGGAARAGPAAPRKVVISDLLSFDDVSLVASCMGLRGTEDVTIRLHERIEWGDYDGYESADLDDTARFSVALGALAPRRLCLEGLRLSAAEAVLLAVPSLTSLELRAPALDRGAAGGLFLALAQHSPALSSLIISDWDGEMSCAMYLLCFVRRLRSLVLTALNFDLEDDQVRAVSTAVQTLCEKRPALRVRLQWGRDVCRGR